MNFARNIVVLAWIGTLAALIVRTQVMDDDRFGLCMFRDVTTFTVEYAWVMPDGTRSVIDSSKHLHGDARQILGTEGRLRDTILGRGALRSQVTSYLRWLWSRGGKHRGADHAEAVLVTRLYDRGDPVTETLTWPRPAVVASEVPAPAGRARRTRAAGGPE